MSQEAGRILSSGSLASSLLGHLAALFLLAMLSLPPAGSQPPEFIELDLSLLELTAEGGGEGGGTALGRPAVGPAGPARHLKPARAPFAPPKKPSKAAPARPRQEPQPLQAAPEKASQEAVDTRSAPSQLAAALDTPETACGSGATGSGGVAGAGWGSGNFGGPATPGAGGIGDGLGPGVGSGLCGVPRDYLLALHSEIERHKTYPVRARRNGWEGKVRVRFIVERDGQISGVKVISSSGCSVLDEAAAATLERIERFPPLPASMRLSRLRLELPLVYRLTR